jgi:putative oxidoreductase
MKGIDSFWEKENFGKLFIRLFLGLLFVASGVRYFSGGISALQVLGAIFSVIGITFWPIIFGIISAVILVLSGMCSLIGFFYRLNCGLLLVIYFLKALGNRSGLKNFFEAEFLLNILIALLLFAFLFMGAGRFSSDGK